jgi:hypothetical protein
MLQYRMVDGFLVSAKNSGTHWLRYMLSAAIASRFGAPPPAHASGPGSDAFIAHPKWPARHGGAPRIGSSHNIPSAAIWWLGRRRLLALPPTVVLVRDIREALVSMHLKWAREIGVPLSDYVRRPAPGRIADAWWYIRFFNHWGEMAGAFGRQVLVVRYEDLQDRPDRWIARIGAHYGLKFQAADIAAAMAVRGRDAIRERLDPRYGEAIVPDLSARRSVRLSDDDERYLLDLLREHLAHDFGYGYVRALTARKTARGRLAPEGALSSS